MSDKSKSFVLLKYFIGLLQEYFQYTVCSSVSGCMIFFKYIASEHTLCVCVCVCAHYIVLYACTFMYEYTEYVHLKYSIF